MSTSWGLLGIFLNVISGLVVAGDMVLNRLMTQLGWPYWTITAIGLFLAACVVAAGLVWSKAAIPARHKLKWIALRGAFGGAYWTLGIVAVQVGAAPGDVAALMSISIIVAALLGRALLGEDLRLLHVGAVACSLAGALLISRPAFLFGDAAHTGAAWLGHVCAASAGFTQSCAYISSRKATDVSVGFHTLSAMAVSTLICCMIPLTSIVRELSPQVIVSSPLESAGWVVVSSAMAMVAVLFACAGAMLCPVAVSVTVYTAASMFSGYVVQTLVFGSTPSTTTLLGAAFMLVAVLLMAMARTPRDSSMNEPPHSDVGAMQPTSEVGEGGGDVASLGSGGSDATRTASGDGDTESLVEFVASEVSALGARIVQREPPTMRIRRPVGRTDSVPASPIGAMMAVIPDALA